jgi:hypothetical protein
MLLCGWRSTQRSSAVIQFEYRYDNGIAKARFGSFLILVDRPVSRRKQLMASRKSSRRPRSNIIIYHYCLWEPLVSTVQSTGLAVPCSFICTWSGAATHHTYQRFHHISFWPCKLLLEWYFSWQSHAMLLVRCFRLMSNSYRLVNFTHRLKYIFPLFFYRLHDRYTDSDWWQWRWYKYKPHSSRRLK